MLFIKAFILLTGFVGSAAFAADLGPCDAWFPAAAPARGVVVLTHGMNLRPAAMDEMAKDLSGRGYEVFRPAFTGHCGTDNGIYLAVKAEQWREDARRFYGIASARAKALNLPLHLVAHSFSALVFQAEASAQPFARRVYLAPALSFKFWYPPLILFFRFLPDYTFDSRNLPQYAVNPVSGARPILAMDDFFRGWRSEGRQVGPALLFVDPADELVSYEGLRAFAAKQADWEFARVSNAGTKLANGPHHLMVDTAALGEAEWSRMMGLAHDFLSAEGAQSSNR